MRDWGRFFATAVVWIAVVTMLNNLAGELTRVSLDFTGVWPTLDYNSPEQYLDALPQVNQAVMSTINQATATINNQMASNMPALVILAALLIVGAALSTFFIWRSAGPVEAAAPMRAAAPAIKSKRGNRVNQMLDSLTDAELDELRARLDDDEAALGDLIDRRMVSR
ncbi:MAG: hypothetical protein JNM70_06635 [Anaerolineae bacterium]|nr:hypothetical protein [Anaerolineae bacterium]